MKLCWWSFLLSNANQGERETSASQLVLDLQVSHLSKTPIFNFLLSRNHRAADKGLQRLHLRGHGLQGGLEKTGHDGLAQVLAPGRCNHLVGRHLQLCQGDDWCLLRLRRRRVGGLGVASLGRGHFQPWVLPAGGNGQARNWNSLQTQLQGGVGNTENLQMQHKYSEMFSKHQVGYLQKIIYTSSVRHAFYFYSFEWELRFKTLI